MDVVVVVVEIDDNGVPIGEEATFAFVVIAPLLAFVVVVVVVLLLLLSLD